MGKTQIKAALCAELVKYLEMAAETHRAAIAHGEAERHKQAVYAEQCDQGVKVIELWKKLAPQSHVITQGYVKLPDGRVVRIDSALIYDCDAMEL